MLILVTGGTGFIGRSLCNRLLAEGHAVAVLSRQPAAVAGLFGSKVTPIQQPALASILQRCDAVINLAGAPIFGPRWSAARKRVLLDSRVTLTDQLVSVMADLQTRPRILLSGSAIGYYGDQGDVSLSEAATPSGGFSHELCAAWERAAGWATELGVRVCTLRTGLVLGPKGGLLQRMSLPFRLGLGGRLGTGRQWMSWIHIDDHVEAMLALLNTPQAQGPYNLTAPTPVTNRVFTEALARQLHRPAIAHLPAPLLRLLLGEMAELLLSSQRVVPQRLTEELGLVFKFPTLELALSDCLKPS